MLDFHFFLFNNCFNFLFLNDLFLYSSFLYDFLLFSLNFRLFLFFFTFLMVILLLRWRFFIIIWSRFRFVLIFIFIIRDDEIFLFWCSFVMIDLIGINTFDFFNNPLKLNSILWILFKHQLRLIVLLLFLLLLFSSLHFFLLSFLSSFSFLFFTSINLLLSLFLFLFTTFLLFGINGQFVWLSCWGYYILNYHWKLLRFLRPMTLTETHLFDFN